MFESQENKNLAETPPEEFDAEKIKETLEKELSPEDQKIIEQIQELADKELEGLKETDLQDPEKAEKPERGKLGKAMIALTVASGIWLSSNAAYTPEAEARSYTITENGEEKEVSRERYKEWKKAQRELERAQKDRERARKKRQREEERRQKRIKKDTRKLIEGILGDYIDDRLDDLFD